MADWRTFTAEPEQTWRNFTIQPGAVTQDDGRGDFALRFPDMSGTAEAMAGGAGVILSDIEAGLKGVNPVALAQADPIAPLVPSSEKPGEWVVSMGEAGEFPLTDYPPEKFVTAYNPEEKGWFLYERTPEMEASGAEMAGRLLGYGQPLTVGGRGTAAMRAAQSAQELGIVPSLGMTGRSGAVAEAGAHAFPITRGRVGAKIEEVAGDLAQVTEEIAGKIGRAVDYEGAGAALREGAAGYVTKFREVSEKLFDNVAAKLPNGPATIVSPIASTQVMQDFMNVFANNPAVARMVGADKWSPILKDIQANGMTYEVARALRTDIGRSLGKMSGPMADMAEGQLKRLYGALSTDLEATARASGPAAVRAWERANKIYKGGRAKIDGALERLLKEGVSDARSMSFFDGLTKKGTASSNIKYLNEIKNSVSAEQWQEVSSFIFRRLGEATAGAQDVTQQVFSPKTFMTNWSKLDPRAKMILFREGLPPGVAVEIDNLLQVVDAARKAGIEQNAPKTTPTMLTGLFGGGVAAGAVLDPATTGAVVGAATGAYLTVRGLTNRTFLRALNSGIARGDWSMMGRLSTGRTPVSSDALKIMQLLEQVEARE